MKEKNTFKNDLTWEQKANENPLFAIMSDEIFEDKSKDFNAEDLDTFYKKGELIWEKYFAETINKNSVSIEKTVLEFGCGMGRLLANPALQGYRCIGLDISETQLSLARVHFPAKSKTEFIKVEPKKQFDVPSESVDVIYSFAVFQHIKLLSDFYFSLNELVRVLKKGGLIKFQFRAPNQYSAHLKSVGFKIYNSENQSVLFYWKKLMGLPVPVIRLKKHTHWSGAGCYVSPKSIIRFFEKKGVKISSIRFDIDGQNIIWITCQK